MNYNEERNNKVLLLSRLRRIRVDKMLRTRGICSGLATQGYPNLGIIAERNRLFDMWPERSGNSWYPVPSKLGMNPGCAYSLSMFKWSKILPYGRARWRLLNFMIDTLEAELGYK